MSDTRDPEPMLAGRSVTLRELETAFGSCPGMVLGYGEGEFGTDGKLRWCTSVLPGNAVPNFVNARHAAGQYGPFLIAMGSLKRAASRGGVAQALYGFALVADASLPARELLWPDQLLRSDAVKKSGDFRWTNGVPFLRVWLCPKPIPFVDLTGIEPRFQRHHGIRIVPLEEVVAGLTGAAQDVVLREAVLDRPKPLLPWMVREIEVTEGELKYRLIGERERDRTIVKAALDANRIRYGDYACQDCGYRPVDDPRVPNNLRRRMLEVHHIELLSKGERKTRLHDLLVLCPLCHRREHVIQRAAEGAATR